MAQVKVRSGEEDGEPQAESANILTFPLSGEQLYLDLLKKCLTRYIFPETHWPLWRPKDRKWHGIRWLAIQTVQKLLASRDLEILRRIPFDTTKRMYGEDCPATAETMIGLKRLDNLQDCITDLIQKGIPGDLLEAGVWRGGAAIFMRGVLQAYGDTSRVVWVADSFQGFPKVDTERYPADGQEDWDADCFKIFAVPLEEVKTNFAGYGLLDERVRFLKGWFKDTLPNAPIERLALLRLDADMYSSTMEVLTILYSKLAVGGYVIVDDYNSKSMCRKAVDDFREQQQITEKISAIDREAVFWQRGK